VFQRTERFENQAPSSPGLAVVPLRSAVGPLPPVGVHRLQQLSLPPEDKARRKQKSAFPALRYKNPHLLRRGRFVDGMKGGGNYAHWMLGLSNEREQQTLRAFFMIRKPMA
jgi:hypothetical protein